MIDEILQLSTNIKATKGKILISEPMLQDESFQKSVIYLCGYDDHESFGFVLNNKSNQDLSVFFPELNSKNFPLYVGGPVDLDSFHMIHTHSELIGGEEIDNKIFWGGDIEQAIENIKLGKIDSESIRFFLGYSGWGEGQLDAELDMNSWLVSHCSQEFVFRNTSSNLWKDAITNLGEKFKQLLFIPQNPQFN